MKPILQPQPSKAPPRPRLADRQAGEARPAAPESGARRLLAAAAAFCAGMAGFAFLESAAGRAGLEPGAAGSALPAQPPLVPFSTLREATGVDGLVRFGGAAPLVSERPAAPSPAPLRLTGAWVVEDSPERASSPASARFAPSQRLRRTPTAALAALFAGLPGGGLGAQPVGGGRIVDFQGELEARAPGGQAPVIDPLVLDLEGAGAYTSGTPVRFDLEGDGRLGVLRDIAPGAGVLVLDSDRDGVSGESGLEVLGDRGDLDGDGAPDGYADGFEALAALVARAEGRGLLRPGTAAAGRLGALELAALERGFGLRIRKGSLNGRALGLAEAGVRALALSREPTVRRDDFDGRGNGSGRRAGAFFTRADGSTGDYQEVFLAYNRASLRRAIARY